MSNEAEDLSKEAIEARKTQARKGRIRAKERAMNRVFKGIHSRRDRKIMADSALRKAKRELDDQDG